MFHIGTVVVYGPDVLEMASLDPPPAFCLGSKPKAHLWRHLEAVARTRRLITLLSGGRIFAKHRESVRW